MTGKAKGGTISAPVCQFSVKGVICRCFTADTWTLRMSLSSSIGSRVGSTTSDPLAASVTCVKVTHGFWCRLLSPSPLPPSLSCLHCFRAVCVSHRRSTVTGGVTGCRHAVTSPSRYRYPVISAAGQCGGDGRFTLVTAAVTAADSQCLWTVLRGVQVIPDRWPQHSAVPCAGDAGGAV